MAHVLIGGPGSSQLLSSSSLTDTMQGVLKSHLEAVRFVAWMERRNVALRNLYCTCSFLFVLRGVYGPCFH